MHIQQDGRELTLQRGNVRICLRFAKDGSPIGLFFRRHTSCQRWLADNCRAPAGWSDAARCSQNELDTKLTIALRQVSFA